MTPRSARIAFLVFGLVWLTLGIWTLTDGDTGTGIVQLALGIAWLLVAAFKGMRPPPRATDGPAHDDHVVSNPKSDGTPTATGLS